MPAQIEGGDALLLDMGAELSGYCADTTCSFPAARHFTDDQRFLFETVRAAAVDCVRARGRRWEPNGRNWFDASACASFCLSR